MTVGGFVGDRGRMLGFVLGVYFVASVLAFLGIE